MNLLNTLDKDKRYTFTASFGGTHTYMSNSCLYTCIDLESVELNSKLIATHIDMNYSKHFLDLGELYLNDTIQFDARTDYKIDYKNIAKIHTNYILVRANNIKRLSLKPVRNPMPGTNNELAGYSILENSNYYEYGNDSKWDYYVHAFEHWSNKNGYIYEEDSLSLAQEA